MKITHYAENSLVKEEQQWDALLSGTSDIALIEPEFNPSVFPISEVGSLPYQFPDEVTAAKTFYDIVTQKAQDEWKDVQVLGVTVIAPAEYRGNVEVNGDVAKFEGTRMRSGGRIETWIIQAFGATPVEIGTGDLSTSLERGMADGAFLSYSLILAMAKDFTKYTTEANMFYRCWVIAMNKDVWNSMPKTVQDQIMGVSGQEGSAKYSAANAVETEGEGSTRGRRQGHGQSPDLRAHCGGAGGLDRGHRAGRPEVDRPAVRPCGRPGDHRLHRRAERDLRAVTQAMTAGPGPILVGAGRRTQQ